MSQAEKPKKNPLKKLINQAAENSNSQISALVSLKTDNSNDNSSIIDIDGKLKLDVNLIDTNPYQPRKEIDLAKIQDLSESIKFVGQIEPVVVRKTSNGRYELIAGERRLRAIKLLGNKKIDVVLQEVSDAFMAITALAENLDREDLSDYETGMAIASIQDLFDNKTQIADYLKRTRKDVHRLLAFDSYPQWIKDRLNANPRLISKSISQSLKAFIESDDYNDETDKDIVIKAMNTLEEGRVTQNLFIDYIKRHIRESKNNENDNLIIVSKSYAHKGKEIGKFTYDEKKLSIKLNASKINKELANEIYQLVDNKIKESLN